MDFICLPTENVFGSDHSIQHVEESIIRRELQRAIHFVNDAINQGESEERIEAELGGVNYLHIWHEISAKH